MKTNTPNRVPVKNHFGLVRHPHSPFWFVSYRDAQNRRLKTSTKIRADSPNSRNLARQIGESIVAGVEVIRNNVDMPGRLKEIYDRMLKAAGQENLDIPTVQDWLGRWLDNQRGSVSESSLKRYQGVVDTLSAYLKSVNRLKVPISDVTSGDLSAFRDSLTKTRSATTVNFYVHLTRMIFKEASDNGLIQRNPAKLVKVLKESKVAKGVFTPGEVTALIAASPSNEWKLLIKAGYFTSQRLGDLSSLQWSAVNFEKNSISFRQEKTGVAVDIPIHPQLLKHLKIVSAQDGPVFPILSKKPVEGYTGLSNTFRGIVTKANIDSGRQDGQRVARKTFHSLRHSSISSMLDANVPEEVRMKISGHNSSAIHAQYSHETWRAMNQAIESIPEV
jgi:integrase